MGAWTEIVDFTFTANETSRSFTGLNITKDDFIKIVVTHVALSLGTEVRMFPNTTTGVSGFDTNANYHSQTLQGDGTSVSAGRVNRNVSFQTVSSQTNSALIYFKLSENGKANIFGSQLLRTDSTLRTQFQYTTSSNLTFNDPITSLTFTADQTNGIATGSRIQIYRLDAEKVADITVTSNSTQVDIPVTGTLDPAINKDSEYLLVSDIVGENGVFYYLTPNDVTTTTSYYSQTIAGIGTSAGAFRGNNPTYIQSGNNALAYTHIKLSEIEAFTFQSYNILNSGASDVFLRNWFGSSTAENITSITKLNIVSSTASTIKTGTRFILYKLK
jgi:hypothetical protein